jgi:hypothetical protein
MIEATLTSGQTVPVPNTPNAASTEKIERVGLQRRRPPHGHRVLMARALSIGKLFESRVKSGSFTRSYSGVLSPCLIGYSTSSL